MTKPKEPNEAEPLKLSVFTVFSSSLVPISVLFGFWLFSGYQITNTNKPQPPNFHAPSDHPHRQHDAPITVEVTMYPLSHAPSPNLIQVYSKHSHSRISASGGSGGMQHAESRRTKRVSWRSAWPAGYGRHTMV